MSDISAIRAALKTAVEQVVGLEVHALMVPSPNVPALMIRPDSAVFADKDNGGMDRLNFRLHLLFSRVDDEAGQDALDDFLSTDAIKAAVEADRKLAGTVDRVRVRGWENYGFVIWGPQELVFLGAELVVEIVAPPN